MSQSLLLDQSVRGCTCAQGQAAGHGREFISCAHVVRTKSVLEDTADCRYQRGAPGEEDTVDGTDIHAGFRYHLFDRLLDRCEIRSNP